MTSSLEKLMQSYMLNYDTLSGVHLEKSPRGCKITSKDICGGGGGGGGHAYSEQYSILKG